MHTQIYGDRYRIHYDGGCEADGDCIIVCKNPRHKDWPEPGQSYLEMHVPIWVLEEFVDLCRKRRAEA